MTFQLPIRGGLSDEFSFFPNTNPIHVSLKKLRKRIEIHRTGQAVTQEMSETET